MNQAMTTLESPIARSEFNRVFQAKLEKSAVEYEKKKKIAKITASISKAAAPALAKAKKKEASADSTKAGGADKQPKTDASKSSSSSSGQKPNESPAPSKASVEQESNEIKTSKTDGTNTDPAKGLKFWDVAGYQLRPFKMWISVRIDSSSARKFPYKEWHNADVAKRVATQFAKQCHRRLLEFKFAKNKKEKIGYMNEIGIKSMTGKETVSDLQTLLEQAIHRVVKRHLQKHEGSHQGGRIYT